MAQTALDPTRNYDSIIHRQHKRIAQLEADLARYTDKLRLLKHRATESHHAALAAATAAAAAHSPVPYAHMHAMLAMGLPAHAPHAHPHAAHLPPFPFAHVPPAHPLAPPNNPDLFAPLARPHVAPVPAAPAAAPLPPPLPQQQQQKHAQPAVVPGQDDDDRSGKTRYWTEMEHNQFLYAVKLFGPKNYVAISQFVGTRTPKQVRTHAQKYQMKLEREAKKRRAQAAAVASVGNPRHAAAAAAAMCEQRMAAVKSMEGGGGCGKEEVKSVSTCLADEVSSMGLLHDGAGSPVSNCDSDDTMADGEVPSLADGLGMVGPHAGGAAFGGGGMKKNSSLGNLADYDDFMKRITSAVEDERVEHGAGMFATGGNAAEDEEDMDMDMLNSHGKSEQFEDALLVDL